MESGDEAEVDDIELAYREAMKSIDEAEQQMGSAFQDLVDDSEPATEENAFSSIGEELADDLDDEPVDGGFDFSGQHRVSPTTVLEAALFVGGDDVSLTARKLASLIGQDSETRLAARLIDELNDRYLSENRPYEIRLREGGFRMELRETYANVAATVFGLGPRDVRLSPEVLEVLAYIAYNQPVVKEDLEGLRQKNVLSHTRRLIRLQLVEVEKTGKKRSDVCYRTAPRFLELFGLSDLAELPQADIFNFK